MNVFELGFIGLMTLGFVNVVTFYKPSLDSKVKFALSVVFAFALTFVPVEFANLLLERIKEALGVALMMSGVYKISQKVGGN